MLPHLILMATHKTRCNYSQFTDEQWGSMDLNSPPQITQSPSERANGQPEESIRCATL